MDVPKSYRWNLYLHKQERYAKGYLFSRQSLFRQAEIMIINKYMQGFIIAAWNKRVLKRRWQSCRHTNEAVYCWRFRQMKQGTKCTRSHDIYVSFSPLQLKLRGIQPSRSLQVFKDFNLFNMAASRANVTLLYISSYFIHLAVFTCHLGTVLFFFRFGLLRNLKIWLKHYLSF